MNDQLLRNFISLVTFDTALQGLEREAKSTETKINTLQEQQKLLSKVLDDEKDAVLKLRKEVDALELQMKAFDEHEAEAKKKIENISNPKQYSALKAELDHVHGEQRALEIQIINAWDLLDSSQKKFNANQEISKAKILEMDESVRLLQQQLAALQRDIAEKSEQRKSLESLVPEDLMRNYKQMRGRVANPVVPVQFDSCSACFYSIPVQDLALLRQGLLIPCKSCYRILYSPEPEE